MSRKRFFTWEGHVVYCKMLVLVGAPFHARKKWWGYEVRLGEYVHGGEPADNWWKQLWCRHMWCQWKEWSPYNSAPTRDMKSRVMNRCVKCNLVSPGPE